MKTLTDYDKQAIEFLHKCNVQFKAEFLKHDKHFADDKEPRDIYKLTLTRGKRAVSFEFGQSIKHSGKYIVYRNGNKAFPYNVYDKPTGYVRLNIDYHLNPDFEVPNEYSLLATLQKYEVGTLENFCDEFGYDVDSKKAEKIYEAVCDEYAKVCMIFNDEELTELQEIN